MAVYQVRHGCALIKMYIYMAVFWIASFTGQSKCLNAQQQRNYLNKPRGTSLLWWMGENAVIEPDLPLPPLYFYFPTISFYFTISGRCHGFQLAYFTRSVYSMSLVIHRRIWTRLAKILPKGHKIRNCTTPLRSFNRNGPFYTTKLAIQQCRITF